MINKTYRKKITMAAMAAALLIQGSVMAEEVENETIPELSPTSVETEISETEAPAPQTEAPQTEAPAPQTEAPAPQTEAPAPQTEAPAPQTEAPAPETSAPETEAPAPETSAPETEAPAPETSAPETEAPAPETSVPETEAPAPKKEASEKESSEKKEKKAEDVTYKTDFYVENDEVIVTAKASEAAQLPEGTVMNVKRIQEGTAEYNAAKQAAESNCGSSQTAEYKFYDVSFVFDGKELKPADGTVSVEVQFKTIGVDSSAKTQKVLQIKEGGAADVTAAGEQGSRMSSVKFAL